MPNRINLKSYLRAYELHRQGYTYSEIAKMGIGNVGAKVRFINMWLKNKRVLKRVRDVAAKYER